MKKSLLFFSLLFLTATCFAEVKLVTPIEPDTQQDIFKLLSQNTANTRLLSESQQKQDAKYFLKRFFAPWHTQSLFKKNKFSDLKRVELSNIHAFESNLGWGENFHRHNFKWIHDIVSNMDMNSFPNTNRDAITVDNTYVRVMPTIDPHYYNFKLPGEGYPFDNFQEAVIWAGTPIHVIQLSNDGAWAYVQSPAVSGWIDINDLAYVNRSFKSTWEDSNFAAVVVEKVPLKDSQGYFRFNAMMGSLFPVIKSNGDNDEIHIPVANLDRNVVIKKALVKKSDMKPMPLAATPYNFSLLINSLLGTPYGWGGLYFYNDCSGTLQSLFTPFGIWLPRNSAAQAEMGQVTELDNMSADNQIDTLKQAKPFLTLLYLPGHIALYVGSYNGELITFQNLWAYIIKTDDGREGRAVLGKAALLKFYPYTSVKTEMVELH